MNESVVMKAIMLLLCIYMIVGVGRFVYENVKRWKRARDRASRISKSLEQLHGKCIQFDDKRDGYVVDGGFIATEVLLYGDMGMIGEMWNNQEGEV